MATYDIIEAALNAPIDWAVFEKLVVEILAQDDMPRLRLAGGYKDSAVDAYEAAVYEDETRANAIVQITSQRAQSLKVHSTLQRLQSVGLTPKAVTFVFRHPVSSSVRAEIGRQCASSGIQCDVRDQTYLMIQLGKNKTGLFPRYFEAVKTQFAALLASPDPLATASDKARHAMLLSVAAFVVHPRARLVRQALFQKTVMAALVALGQATEEEVSVSVKQLMPEEDIPAERVAAALAELAKDGDCTKSAGKWCGTDACLARFGSVMGSVQEVYGHMLGTILSDCRKSCGNDQAAIGIIERNIRRALLRLLRVAGPFEAKDEDLPFLCIAALPEIRDACLKI